MQSDTNKGWEINKNSFPVRLYKWLYNSLPYDSSTYVILWMLLPIVIIPVTILRFPVLLSTDSDMPKTFVGALFWLVTFLVAMLVLSLLAENRKIPTFMECARLTLVLAIVENLVFLFHGVLKILKKSSKPIIWKD